MFNEKIEDLEGLRPPPARVHDQATCIARARAPARVGYFYCTDVTSVATLQVTNGFVSFEKTTMRSGGNSKENKKIVRLSNNET